MSDPRLQRLASETAQKIKAVASDRDNQIQQIYQQYQEQAAAIRAEATSQDLNRLTDDLSPEPHPRAKTLGATLIMSDPQHFQQWQASPIQGAISRQSPFSAEDEFVLLETLTNCQVQLVEALKVAKRYSRLPDLEIGISDALSGVYEAVAVIVDPKTYLE